MNKLFIFALALQQLAVPAAAFQHLKLQPLSRTSPLKSTGTSGTIERVEKTEEEWQAELSPQEFYVLRQQGTEAPNTSPLNDVEEAGTFICAGCGAPLFTTSAKYESGTGWPSFFQPVDRAAVDLKVDFKMLLPRTEVTCASCDGHLGHVFEDGPEPTGQRYCMNGISMKFRPDETNEELAATVARRLLDPYKPAAKSQVPAIAFNALIGGLFFASFVSRISDLEAIGQAPGVFDFFPVVPAVFYGVQAAQGVKRLL